MPAARRWPVLLALLLLCPVHVLSQTVPINGNLVVAGHTNACLATGTTNTYACALDFPITAYVTRACYSFTANAANTAAATLNLNSIGAKTIKKVQGGITTDLVADDIRTGQVVQVCYDGTNLQMVSPLGNAPSGSSGITTDTAQRAAFYLTTTTVDGAPGLTFAADGTTIISYADRITTLSTSATLGVNDGPTVTCDATAGNVTATLPDGTTTTQRRFTLVKIDASANTCIIAPNATGTDTINGVAGNATLTARWDRYDVVLLSTATAANWAGAYGIAGPLSVAQGGTGTGGTLTGFLRGSASAMTAAELSGAVTTSGSTATTLDAKYRTLITSAVIDAPTTADSGKVQWYFPTAITITRVVCSVGSATSITIQLDERAEATPNTAGTNVMTSALVCDVDSQATTTFTNATIATRVPLNLQITAASGTPTSLRVHVEYLID